MKYDVEIGARLLDKFSYVVVAELTTQHYSNAVYVNEQNDDFGIWHSHGKLLILRKGRTPIGLIVGVTEALMFQLVMWAVRELLYTRE